MHLKLTTFIAVNIFILSLFLFSTNKCMSQENQLNNSLNSIISKYMDKNKVAGLSVCVIKNESIFWSNSYGYANLEENIHMNIDAIMNIASISKTITATAVLQLWERGQLDLDADINKYLAFKVRNPNFPETPITIRQLLTHTSSINDSKAYYESYACGDPVIDLPDWIKSYFENTGRYYDEKNNFHSWKPGEGYKYSNVAFGLLGFIIEEITKQPFSEYCKINIISPLGMNNSAWFIKDIDTLKQAKQYVKANRRNKKSEWISKLNSKQIGNYLQLCNYSFYNYPDGLFKTSVKELSYFLRAIMNQGVYNGERVLEKTTVSEMLTLQLEDNNRQGLCWVKEKHDPLWGHSGSDPGIQTYMYFDYHAKMGIILFQNSGSGNAYKLVKNLLSVMEESRK